MLFNSIEFLIFLPIVFLLYWSIPQRNIKLQNSLLVLASYIFYGWWDWRFLGLIVLSSAIDYIVGLKIFQAVASKRKQWLYLSLFVNLSLLGLFKYYNFFAESFNDAFTLLGQPIDLARLNIILPVGISFYTFQTLSYSIDIYKGKLEPTKSPIAFFAFICFFPQLVAGPIERAKDLLPQFLKQRKFTYSDGLRGLSQITWGLFKKVVVADNCAFIVNQIFNDYQTYSGSTLLLGAFLFAFQIYGDFSGYSDIAIGTARLFGFELKQNFAYPYFARNITEFWRRWHISLTSWFRDYVYIPLGGNRGGVSSQIANTFIVFSVSGLWHGANWTFVAWGLYNAFLFLPSLLFVQLKKQKKEQAMELIPSFMDLVHIATTFILTTLGWIFFRSESIEMAIAYFRKLFSPSLFSMPYVFGVGMEKTFITIWWVGVMLGIEWWQKKQSIPIMTSRNGVVWLLIYLFMMIIFLFGQSEQGFIYFQF